MTVRAAVVAPRIRQSFGLHTDGSVLLRAATLEGFEVFAAELPWPA